MLDQKGFRLNVGIILTNHEGKLFWAKRVKGGGWQFPQGGVGAYETLEETMYRELEEETGLNKESVKILAVTKHWLTYTLPDRFIDRKRLSGCIGQKQKWFLLLLVGKENHIDLNRSSHPEFSNWKWVNYWEPLDQVIYFKKQVYRRALKELKPVVEQTASITIASYRPSAKKIPVKKPSSS